MSSIKRETESACRLNAGTVGPNNFETNPSALDKAELIVVSEHEIIHDLIYCFQGMEGKYIKYDGVNECFTLDPLVSVRSKHLILRLTELGRLVLYIKKRTNTITEGSVAQCLAQAIVKEFHHYHVDLASIEVRLLKQQRKKALRKRLTLVQLDFWSQTYVRTFRVLHDILKFIDGKHAGKIISFLSNLVHHVDPAVNALTKKLVVEAFFPYHKRIVNWMKRGELNDVYDEFFVKENPGVEETDIWENQFELRRDMIPTVMSTEQAMQILRTGHYVHFLRNMCNERGALPSICNSEYSSTELSRLLEPVSELSISIENDCIKMSTFVLHILKTRFNFEAHLKALRKYMLLGDGDFVHCFMETLETKDLKRIPGILHECTLQTALNWAVESTNAGNDSADVLSRLRVKKMVSSGDDFGWDVFCLVYALDRPLNTVLKVSNGDYSQVFKYLWRIKRAQYFLTKMWKDVTLLYKKTSSIILELRSMFILASLLVNPMLQFVNNFQHYIGFEVIEMSWISFQDEVRRINTLDAVIKAHSQFIESIQKGCLFHDVDTMCSVRSLLDCVMELIPAIEIMCHDCKVEYNRRKQYEADIAKHGTSRLKEEEYQQGVTAFRQSLRTSKCKISLVTKKFKDCMCTLLTKLSDNESYGLQVLGCQIDFNEYYQNIDKKLFESFKFCNRSYCSSFTAGSSTNSLSCSNITLDL